MSKSSACTVHRDTSDFRRPPPEVPFSSHGFDNTEIRTHFPDFSHTTATLFAMIKEQSSCAPCYTVQIHGSHKETERNGNKETKRTVQDFSLRLNLTDLLAQTPMESLPNNKRGYRGGIIPMMKPVVGPGGTEDAMDEVHSWCESYVRNPAAIKSFTLERKITNHDQKKLEQLLRSAIYETNYKGHVEIKFLSQYTKLIVYSPGKINEWRTTNWIRWVFYLTFLWIVSWPILFFLTRKYQVVKVNFQYADVLKDDGGNRKCAVMSEVEWFNLWESAIKRAALARMLCEDTFLDDAYRISTAQADARGLLSSMQPQQQPLTTGNSFADGALSFLGQGLRVAEVWNTSRGWGGDC